MEFFEVINQRRSVRKFSEDIVNDEVIQKALNAALKAPNSSNIQPWEFYWVKSQDKKDKLINACLSQNAAKTASHLIVAVSRIDTWKRNRNELLRLMNSEGEVKPFVLDYYNKIVPLSYTQGPLNIFGFVKSLMFFAIGLFRPVPRGPNSKSSLFEVVTKTTALACENFMLSITAQGYGSCPMEGFDEVRVKKILNLNRHSHVVMVIGVGKIDQTGIYGEQLRNNPSNFLFTV